MLACLLLGACTAHDVVVGDLEEVASIPYVQNRDLDILFVVDNSPSMADKQQSLAQNFPRMIDVLSTLDGGLPNLHIGVITSDMGTLASNGVSAAPVGGGQGACAGSGNGGQLQHASPAVAGAFISDVALPDGTRDRNYTGDLHDVFSQNALVGDVGCGFEQHLHSLRAALDNNLANADFVRPGANLAVVILADEDDCSVRDPSFFAYDNPDLGPLQSYRCTKLGVVCDGDDPDHPHDVQTGCVPRDGSPFIDDVQPYADFLTGLKPDPRMLMVAAIAGAPEPFSTTLAPPPGGGTPVMTLAPSCTFAEPDGTTAHADPAVRLAAFANAFPGRAKLTSICNADLSGALVQIGATAKAMIGDPCLADAPLADTCVVTDVTDSQPQVETLVPRCVGGSETCFDIAPDAAACPYTGDHLKLSVTRTAIPPADTRTHVRCQLAP
jgi:hypothetical protein